MTFDDLVEVKLPNPDAFLVVKETLSRIGIASKKDKTLYQSTHILHKRGRYAIASFKELFSLDGKPTDISENDIARRNTIINLLVEWKLVELANEETGKLEPTVPISEIKIVKFNEKKEWSFHPKYTVGGNSSGNKVILSPEV
jgi:hypothetical protein